MKSLASRIPYQWRPGAGFVILVCALVASTAVFAWGLRTPPLERFWRLQLELDLGERGPLSAAERALFQDVLRRHPEIATAILEDAPTGILSAADGARVTTGYAYLVRPQGDRRGLLRVQLADVVEGEQRSKVRLRVRAGGAEHEADAQAHVPFEWRLPAEGPYPQLIEVTATSKKGTALRVELVEEAR